MLSQKNLASFKRQPANDSLACIPAWFLPHHTGVAGSSMTILSMVLVGMARELAAFLRIVECVMNSAWINLGYFRTKVVSLGRSGLFFSTESAIILALIIVWPPKRLLCLFLYKTGLAENVVIKSRAVRRAVDTDFRFNTVGVLLTDFDSVVPSPFEALCLINVAVDPTPLFQGSMFAVAADTATNVLPDSYPLMPLFACVGLLFGVQRCP